jgi:hypothetical protein
MGCVPKAALEVGNAKIGHEKGDGRGKGTARQRDKALASAQRRAQRARQTKLAVQLDSMLPARAKGEKSANGAGGRSVGTEGRSMQDVLTDTIEHLRNLRAGRDSFSRTCEPSKAWQGFLKESKQGGRPMTGSFETSVLTSADELDVRLDGSIFRHIMQSSRALAQFEVAMPGWTVTSVNPGARALLGNFPFIEMVGQCLLNGIVHEEDIDKLEGLWMEAHAAYACRTQHVRPFDASSNVLVDPPSPFGVKCSRAQASCSDGGSPSARARIRLLRLGVGLEDHRTETSCGDTGGTHLPAVWTSAFCTVDVTMVGIRQWEVG